MNLKNFQIFVTFKEQLKLLQHLIEDLNVRESNPSRAGSRDQANTCTVSPTYMGTYLSTTTSIIDRHDAEPQRHHSTKMILHMMWYERHPQILCSSILTLKPMVSSSNCPIRKNQYPGVTSLSVSKHHCRELTHHQTTPTPHQSSTCGGCITGRLTCTTAALSTTDLGHHGWANKFYFTPVQGWPTSSIRRHSSLRFAFIYPYEDARLLKFANFQIPINKSNFYSTYLIISYILHVKI